MKFSLWRLLWNAPVHLTEWLIFGTRGIDIRFRLALAHSFEQQALSEQGELSDVELKDRLLRALPLRLGDWFPGVAWLLTAVGGVLFIRFAGKSVVRTALQIHVLFGRPLDYVLLALQWIVFYL